MFRGPTHLGSKSLALFLRTLDSHVGPWGLDEELGDEGRLAAERERLLDLVHASNMQV